MYDQPTAEELIDAARMHFETAIVPAVRGDPRLYFQTLVAINVLKIVQREMVQGEGHARAEWARLDALLGEEPTPESDSAMLERLEERNADLAVGIRKGEFDADPHALFEHLKATAVEALQVANPRFLSKIQAEQDDPSQDAWATRNHV